MKIIIIGAGELGRLLANALCGENHEVTIIDTSSDEFERIKEKLDLRVVEGSCVDISVLKNAGVESADAMLAVTGDEPSNIIACQLARHFGVKKTICRLYSEDSFSPDSGITPDFFGIWRTFSPPRECVRKIMDVLENPIVLEKIKFTNPGASMKLIDIKPSSILAGTRLKDIPSSDKLSKVRFAAIVRGRLFLIPHGDTIIVPGDKVYVAGPSDSVDEFVKWSAGEEDGKLRKIIIAGATITGSLLAENLISEGYDVRFIEADQKKGEKLLDNLPRGFMVIQGNPTDEEVMEEAGIQSCDAFITTAEDDEENILSCIMAKRLGAQKAITITHKPEYIQIVPSLEVIDCGFSSSLVSVNTVFRLLETGTMRIDAKLQYFHAHMTEFKVSEKSPLNGKTLAEAAIPASSVFAMIFRGDEVIPPSGSTVMLKGDTVVTILTPDGEKELEPLFPR